MDLQRSSQIPYLKVNSVDIRNNPIYLEIENLTNSLALWLGISTAFYLVYPQYSADSKGEGMPSASRLEKLIKENQTIYVKYLGYGPNEPRLVWESKIVQTHKVVSFPKSGYAATYFPPHDSIKLEVEPLYFVRTKELLGSGKAFKYDEIREYLLQNNINHIAVDI